MRWLTFWTRCVLLQKSGEMVAASSSVNSFRFSARSKITSEFLEAGLHLFSLVF